LRIWIRFSVHDPNASPLKKKLFYLPLLYLNFFKGPSPECILDSTSLQSSQSSIDDKIGHIVSDFTEDLVTSPQREHISNKIAELVNVYIQRRFSSIEPNANLEILRKYGIVELKELTLSEEKVSRIRAYLDRKPVYAAHIPEFSDQIPRFLTDPKARAYPFGSFSMQDVVNAPELLELAFDARVLAIAEAYLGCAPSLYSIHSWWSFPGHSSTGPQFFHRDIDDFKFLALFVYLTNIEGGEKGGHHELIHSTQRQDLLARNFDHDEGFASEFFPPKSLGGIVDETKMLRRVFGNKIQSITGKAGSVFLADTYALHRGVRPTESPRLVCWIRYGYRANIAYKSNRTRTYDFDWKSGRIADDPYNRFVSRLLLK
jgi:hypothetical protein